MIMRGIVFYWAVLTMIVVTHVQAQSLTLKVPVEQTVYLGEEWILPLSVHDIKHYTLLMEGQPASSRLKENTFHWTPQTNELRHYLIHFKLLDTNQVLLDESVLSLTVEDSHHFPNVVFHQQLSDTIQVTENKPFSFTATLQSKQNTNTSSLSTYFLFNEDPSIRSFDSCNVHVNGDQLVFHWTPSNREALAEYAKFRITLVDSDHALFSKVLTFKIKNVNQSPYFIHDSADTLYYSAAEGLRINCEASDPDQDKLTYDFSPKHVGYELQGTDFVIEAGGNRSSAHSAIQPATVVISVSDHAQIAKRKVVLIPQAENLALQNHSFQPIIGDFTKKIFSEGDSIVTFLNVSNDIDLTNIDITYTDLNLPPGINSLTKYLVFEKESSYIKVHSKGILPYNLVDHDYNYNITVLLTSRGNKSKSSLRVLVLTIENRADPQNLTQQKDSLLTLVKQDLIKEEVYRSTLVKIKNRIHKPWWKKIAIVTGTVSGVLTLIQIENPNKTISLVSASISLLSIVVTNIPSFSEKTVSLLDEKMANSKSRQDNLRRKEYEFRYNWSLYMAQSDFDKIRTDLEDLLNKNTSDREIDICRLLHNKKVMRKVHSLIKHPAGLDKQSIKLEELFKCKQEQAEAK